MVAPGRVMDIRNRAIIEQFVCNARRIAETEFERFVASYIIDYDDIYVIYRKNITAASTETIALQETFRGTSTHFVAKRIIAHRSNRVLG
jgi:deoxyribodipyrimidine photolyase